MSERRWYRSLYWRIGLGFIALLALLMVAQTASFVWIAAATEGGLSPRVGQDFAELVANEFESALADEPGLDLPQYAASRLSEFHRPAFVMFPDGRVVGPPGVDVPPGLERLAALRGRMPRGWRGLPPGRPPGAPFDPPPGRPPGRNPPWLQGAGDMPGAGTPGRGGSERAPADDARGAEQATPPAGAVPADALPRPRPFPRRRAPVNGAPPGLFAGEAPPTFARRPLAVAPVRTRDGSVAATVFVSPVVGWQRIAQELGPWLAVGTLVLLAGGTALAALVVFRPARRQLHGLEDAARRLGDGDLSARAPAEGGDEVAAVAHAFNRMADDLVARQVQLTEADRARRQLLADVSHELMTPLTAIRGYADTLALPQFGPDSAQGQRSVKVIQEEVERIDRLVSDLLDLARYEASGVTLVIEDVSIAELFDRVVARHEPAAHDKQVTIDVHLPDEEMVVLADAGRLEQALQNLTSNALRHTPGGGRVMVSAEQHGGRTWLRVADTGAGIAPEHLPHVFDRFYKADPSRSEAGSGLGLSIVRAIVERLGGSVRASSRPGVETVFEIELPNAGSPGVIDPAHGAS